eukprot:m.132163 g.132163  ORF g.132163 m.132163 type:complete len:374 (+) comp29594_c0_seq1:186-1307(+)
MVGRVELVVIAFAMLFAIASCFENHRQAPQAGQEKAPKGTPNVHCESTKGPFTIEMHPEWAPIGAKQFLAAVKDGVYDDTVIYRVVRDQAVQFGFPKDPEIRGKWRSKPSIKDDPQIFKNPNFHRGMIAFAGGGKDSRGIDVFITFMTGNANGTPRAPWESPIGIIDEEGMKAVTSFNPEYGDFDWLGGNAPNLGKGYESLKKTHPNLDYLGKCKLVYAPGESPQEMFGDTHHDEAKAAAAVVGAPINRGNAQKVVVESMLEKKRAQPAHQVDPVLSLHARKMRDAEQPRHGNAHRDTAGAHSEKKKPNSIPGDSQASSNTDTNVFSSAIVLKLGGVRIAIPMYLIVFVVVAFVVVKFVLPKRISRKIMRLEF